VRLSVRKNAKTLPPACRPIAWAWASLVALASSTLAPSGPGDTTTHLWCGMTICCLESHGGMVLKLTLLTIMEPGEAGKGGGRFDAAAYSACVSITPTDTLGVVLMIGEELTSCPPPLASPPRA
jgi:hypothetical protein